MLFDNTNATNATQLNVQLFKIKYFSILSLKNSVLARLNVTFLNKTTGLPFNLNSKDMDVNWAYKEPNIVALSRLAYRTVLSE